MKYNVIGDIHGRTCWKDLIIPDGVNIFTGDYFSPYDKKLTFEHCKKNFLEILEFKRQRPETVLLIGNHDEEHWHWIDMMPDMTRENFLEDHKMEIHDLFEQNKDLFQIAYSAGNKFLVTHAGVSAVWLYRMYLHLERGFHLRELDTDYINLDYEDSSRFKYFNWAYLDYVRFWKKHYQEFYQGIREYKERKYILAYWKGNWYKPTGILNVGLSHFKKWKLTPDFVAKKVDKYWRMDPSLMRWKVGADYYDAWGNSIGQSPVWLRPPTILECNVFRGSKEYYQVVGHTQWWEDIHTESYDEDPRTIKEITFTDCLGHNTSSFKFETEEK